MGCQSLRGELASAPTRARTSTERLQSQTEQRADGVKAVSRRRRGRVAPALSPADHWSTSAQLLPGDRAFLSPSSCEYGWSAPGRADFASAKLDAGVEASGPHDFAVRSNIVRLRACNRSRVGPRPATTIARRRCRVHRIPCPTFVTIAKRPSVWDGMAGVLKLIWVSEEAQYFCKRGWTAEIDLPVGHGARCERAHIPTAVLNPCRPAKPLESLD